jgi:hypothetical protein
VNKRRRFQAKRRRAMRRPGYDWQPAWVARRDELRDRYNRSWVYADGDANMFIVRMQARVGLQEMGAW